MNRSNLYRALSIIMTLALALITAKIALAETNRNQVGQWVAGDFHTHTYLTDGQKTEVEVVANAFGNFGLDWLANSEHGGAFKRDPYGTPWTQSQFLLPGTPVNANGTVWRWISLKDYSYPIVQSLRSQYPNNLLIQGLEWNVPTHEHASVGIIADEPIAVSDFEYTFDASDSDTSRAPMPKLNSTHANAVAGAAWLENSYKTTSYFLLNHPSRKLLYTPAAIRDFNNAAPDVAFGLEGLPGHQKESYRGGYGNFFYNLDNTVNVNKTMLARTFGGADYMLAKVGGIMDSLWGEGRHFWVFVNSDFHDSAEDADFWPGEYAKSYTFVANKDYQSIVNGLRSGNSFAVHGDLINALDFTAKSKGSQATMGQSLAVQNGDNILIKIRFKSPEMNYCGASPKVDHIDLIAGGVTGLAQPGTAAYDSANNPSTQVVATYSSPDMQYDDGWYVMTYQVKKANADQYFRLRGTNLGYNVPGETENGNPLVDSLLAGDNTREKACSDLWFYSNPIFVDVQ